MRLLSALAITLLASACATERAVSAPATPTAEAAIFRAAELARVRCLVVAPFENASNAPLAADAATAAMLAGVGASGTRVFPVKELRALFRDTPVELPEGIPPGLALELAQLVGADAAVYGTVEGTVSGPGAGLLVSVRLALSQGRELLYAITLEVTPRPGETAEAAVRRTLADAIHGMVVRLGGARGAACFERKRLDALRSYALAEAAARAPAPPPAAPCPAAAPPPPPPPAAAPKPIAVTARQKLWARQLAGRDPVIVEDVSFAGRTSELQRDSGLADLAVALASAPELKIRIEGFVDATHDAAADARLSAAMAQVAADRLAELGVSRARIQVAGRGAESPRLPNFTARGRAANRRIEAVGVK